MLQDSGLHKTKMSGFGTGPVSDRRGIVEILCVSLNLSAAKDRFDLTRAGFRVTKLDPSTTARQNGHREMYTWCWEVTEDGLTVWLMKEEESPP